MAMRTLNPEAILRRYHRLMNANRRRFNAANALPKGTPARAEAVAKYKAWNERVNRPLDRRLWPIMEKSGMGVSL